MTSFTEQAAAAGYVATVRLLEAARSKASEEVAERLAVRPGAAVHLVERLRLVDGAPMAVETSQLSAARFPGLLRELRRGSSLYKILEESYGVVPVAAEETMSAMPAMAIRVRNGRKNGRISRKGLRDFAFFRPEATRATSLAYSSPGDDMCGFPSIPHLYRRSWAPSEGPIAPALSGHGRCPIRRGFKKPLPESRLS